MFKKFKSASWPTLNEELSVYKNTLYGKMLNAGCGKRDISFTKVTKVINIDISPSTKADVICNLEKTPFNDEEFDSILNIAVLEHCRKPWEVVKEMHRILKENGKVLCCVPFFQPIHKVPEDYFRFTPDGLVSLFVDSGFQIEQITITHSMFHVIGWMLEDIQLKLPIILKLLFIPFSVITLICSKYLNKLNIATFPCAVTIVAVKKP